MKQEKYKIFFALNTLNFGGIEKSAITLLSLLDPDRFDVTLSLDKAQGDFMQFLPEWIKIRPIPYDPESVRERSLGSKRYIPELVLSGRILSAINNFWINYKEHKLSYDGRRISRALRFYDKSVPNNEIYDLAVAFADLEELVYVSEYIKAKKKITWFHTQLDSQREDLSKYIKYIDNYQTLFGVSEALCDSLKKCFPQYINRIKLYPHIINTGLLYSWAGMYSAQWPMTNSNTIKILSVGRLAFQKGFDLIPKIASRLKKDGFNISWYIIGEGPEYKSIKGLITENNVAEEVKLLGSLSNPYPYFKECDIYIQPSRYEGYCLTLAEARAFHKPIVSTIFDGSTEQLDNGYYGCLVNCNEDDLYLSVKHLFENPQNRLQYIERLRHSNIDSNSGFNTFINEIENL